MNFMAEWYLKKLGIHSSTVTQSTSIPNRFPGSVMQGRTTFPSGPMDCYWPFPLKTSPLFKRSLCDLSVTARYEQTCTISMIFHRLPTVEVSPLPFFTPFSIGLKKEPLLLVWSRSCTCRVLIDQPCIHHEATSSLLGTGTG